jgi:hypothetical protein
LASISEATQGLVYLDAVRQLFDLKRWPTTRMPPSLALAAYRTIPASR